MHSLAQHFGLKYTETQSEWLKQNVCPQLEFYMTHKKNSGQQFCCVIFSVQAMTNLFTFQSNFCPSFNWLKCATNQKWCSKITQKQSKCCNCFIWNLKRKQVKNNLYGMFEFAWPNACANAILIKHNWKCYWPFVSKCQKQKAFSHESQKILHCHFEIANVKLQKQVEILLQK